MWYVIRTTAGKEDDMCMWINSQVDKNLFTRCFVPLYEDVWRKGGIGHIDVRRLFDGYLFLETDAPQDVYLELKKLPKNPLFIYAMDQDEKVFLPIYKEEEIFLDSVLSDGLMRVSYIHLDQNRRIDVAIGPLEGYLDRIVRLDIAHRRALVRLSVAGEEKLVKFGLWLEKDPKIGRIEEEKKRRGIGVAGGVHGHIPEKLWDRKAGRRHTGSENGKAPDTELYGFKAGDRVINTSGVFGDLQLEVVSIDSYKNLVKVKAELFGKETIVEMALDEVVKCERIRTDSKGAKENEVI